MKSRASLIVALTATLLLPSCVAQRLQKKVDAERALWIGRKESELVDQKGAPSRVVDTSDWKIWVYKDRGKINLASSGNSIRWQHDWEYWIDRKRVIQKVRLRYQYGH